MSAADKPGPGKAVDSSGGPTFDPSTNVLDLVEAAVKRIDDLRSAEMRRQDDLRAMTTAHNAELHRITSDFQHQLRDAEAKRIDAIRAFDVNAVSVASSRASEQASVLATQVQTSADTLRSLVASSAATVAQQLTAALSEITKRLAELERTKYEGAGRSTVTDPAMAELVVEMRELRQAGASKDGKSEGVSAAWVALIGVISLLGTLIGIGSVLYGALKP